jgi:hypothetical protein
LKPPSAAAARAVRAFKNGLPNIERADTLVRLIAAFKHSHIGQRPFSRVRAFLGQDSETITME